MEFRDLKKQYEINKTDIDSAIKEVLSAANFISGRQVRELEEELSEYVGRKHCISCANGTDAITIALRCLGIGKGDGVFIPDFTFFSTGEAPALLGAEVIFVDVDENTFNIDPEKLEEEIKRVKSEGKTNPRAVIAVDLFGLSADYKEIERICGDYNLYLIEDAAQGFGGGIVTGDGHDIKRNCSFGDISTTSFFPAKPLGCYGDGGAIFTDNDKWAEIIRSIAVHGKGTMKYDNVRLGYNSRLDTIQAAVLKVKFKVFREKELDLINLVAKRYEETFKMLGVPKVDLPVFENKYLSSWAQYTIKLPDGQTRDKVQLYLKNEGILSMVYYPKPMHRQEAFSYLKDSKKDYEKTCRVTNLLCEQVLSLPMHPYLTKEEIKRIAECVNFAI